MKELIELLVFILFIVICTRSCNGCSEDYHNDYGVKGLGESIIYGESYMIEKYDIKKGK